MAYWSGGEIADSAIFASTFLKETLGPIGRIGCLLSVVGAVIVVVHAPEDKNVTSIDELLFYALQPGNKSNATAKARETMNANVSTLL